MASSGTLLVGYDVEKTTQCAEFLSKMQRIHSEFETPCTVFALGSCVASVPDVFAKIAANPLIDMGQHTYSHILLKTVSIDDGKTIEVVNAASLEDIRTEITRASDAIESICGTVCVGLSGPWGYYRGLSDRPDVLEVLKETGLRYLRTFARNEVDYQPVSLNAQPFWYEPQGYPDVLECMAHGWQDVYLRSRIGWSNVSGYLEQMKGDLDFAADHNLVYSWCCNDWSALREDPDLWIIRGVLKHAKESGMQVLSYRQFWAQQEALRKRSIAA